MEVKLCSVICYCFFTVMCQVHCLLGHWKIMCSGSMKVVWSKILVRLYVRLQKDCIFYTWRRLPITMWSLPVSRSRHSAQMAKWRLNWVTSVSLAFLSQTVLFLSGRLREAKVGCLQRSITQPRSLPKWTCFHMVWLWALLYPKALTPRFG